MSGSVESAAGRLAQAVVAGDREGVTRLLRAAQPVDLPRVLLQTVLRATAQAASERQQDVDAFTWPAGRPARRPK